MKIKSCPFCGGEVKLMNLAGWEIGCKCGLNMVPSDSDFSKDEFIEQWNKRASQWVSVEDKLPELNQRVLCYHEDWGISISYLDNSGYIKTGLIDDPATHWQFLPTVPEG